MRILKFCKIFTVIAIIVLFFAYLHFKNLNCLSRIGLKTLSGSWESESGRLLQNYSSDKMCKLFVPSSQKLTKIKPTVTLAIVACGGRLQEAVTLLKSAIIFGRDVQLNVIVFVDNRTRSSMPKQLEILKKSAAKLKVGFTFTIYDSWFPPKEERVWRKMFAPCSTQRLFFPSLLPDIETLIYMDSDTLFLSNVKDLWDHFDEIRETDNKHEVLAAMAPEHELPGDGWYNIHAKIPYYGPRGLNAGVMLMNVSKFREQQVEEKLLAIYLKYKYKIIWADQDLLNIYFHYFPNSLYELSCDFNYRIQHCDCQYRGDCTCKPAMFNGISILHGNRKMFHTRSHRYQFAKNIYNAFKEYNLDEDSPTELLQYIQRQHEDLSREEEDHRESVFTCNKLNFHNIFKKFIMYLNK